MITDPQPVLRFVGDESRSIPGIPSRDLDEADIARAVYVRTVGPQGPHPEVEAGVQHGEKAFADEAKALTESLIASGLFRAVGGAEKAGGASRPTRSKSKPKTPAAPAPAEISPDQGDQPAEE